MATFTHTQDRYGRTIMVSDPETVAILARASVQGWTEYPGIAYGNSQEYAPGTQVHGLCLELHTAMEAAGLGYVGWLYSTDAERMTTGEDGSGPFIRDRAADRVVCRMPSFGYVDDPANTPVQFHG